jgi:hypothetical protein
MFLARDEKASGTAPQAGVTNAWTTRNLTNSYGTTVGATLAANAVTLPAGTYSVFGWAAGGNNQKNTARLYNNTDATVITVGTPMSSNSAAITTVSSIDFVFTIASGKALVIQSYSANTNVMGRANAIPGTIEIYSYLRFTRIS